MPNSPTKPQPKPDQLPAVMRLENEKLTRELAVEHNLVFPLITSDAVLLCELLGYECDVVKIEWLALTGRIIHPHHDGGQYLWFQEDICNVCDVLERQRAFMPNGRHRERMTNTELTMADLFAENLADYHGQWSYANADSILRELVFEADYHRRQILAHILLERLRTDGELT